jgi:hypothetical protein
MGAGLVQRDEVGLLTRGELGLLAAEAPACAGDLHALAGPHPDEVGLKFGEHRQHVEQQAPDRVGRIMDRSAEVQLDLTRGELVGDVASVGKGPGEPVELGYDEGVAVAAGRERFA